MNQATRELAQLANAPAEPLPLDRLRETVERIEALREASRDIELSKPVAGLGQGDLEAAIVALRKLEVGQPPAGLSADVLRCWPKPGLASPEAMRRCEADLKGLIVEARDLASRKDALRKECDTWKLRLEVLEQLGRLMDELLCHETGNHEDGTETPQSAEGVTP
jgi:hypothetical protein